MKTPIIKINNYMDEDVEAITKILERRHFQDIQFFSKVIAKYHKSDITAEVMQGNA